MSNPKSPRQCEQRKSKLLQEGQQHRKKNRSWEMAIGWSWHPNPLSIRGQSATLIPFIFGVAVRNTYKYAMDAAGKIVRRIPTKLM